MSELTGGCACGAVRYRLGSGPMFVNCCHCSDCQRQVGSAFVINAIIEADRIELMSATPRPVRMPTDSGRPHERTLWSAAYLSCKARVHFAEGGLEGCAHR